MGDDLRLRQGMPPMKEVEALLRLWLWETAIAGRHLLILYRKFDDGRQRSRSERLVALAQRFLKRWGPLDERALRVASEAFGGAYATEQRAEDAAWTLALHGLLGVEVVCLLTTVQAKNRIFTSSTEALEKAIGFGLRGLSTAFSEERTLEAVGEARRLIGDELSRALVKDSGVEADRVLLVRASLESNLLADIEAAAIRYLRPDGLGLQLVDPVVSF